MSIHLDKVFANINQYVEQAQTLYKTAEDTLVHNIKQILPEETHRVAEKVARAVPETLVSASMITGTLKLGASIYGIARLIWAATPIIQTCLKGQFDGQPMQDAAAQAFERIKQINESFRPAIFLSCAVAAAAATVLGALSLSPTLTMTGTFMGMISYMALDSMKEPAPAPQPQVAHQPEVAVQ
ncbi:MAG: hypothetical protein JSR37_06280 [Verrucomicrobia bacterium]|nr:hypothetical protein [Verrucomicrobiota bacterium]